MVRASLSPSLHIFTPHLSSLFLPAFTSTNPGDSCSSIIMEEIEESEASWLDESGEELLRELLNDDSLLFVSPKVAVPEPDVLHESIINKLISTVYSGPTISDIESALSVGFRSGENVGRSSPAPIVSLPEKGLGRIENKYTLKIKICGNGLADDGYKWRKYGQKSIKNSPNPRSYYRCTNPRCNAKKQVEKSTDNPETLIVTYEGLHLHYTYSHFLLPRTQDYSISNLHAPKKPRIQTTSQQTMVPDDPTEPTTQSPTIMEQQHAAIQKESPSQGLGEDATQAPLVGEDLQNWLLDKGKQSPQGLLEDVVPLLVRKPCTSTACSSEPSPSSQASSPSCTSSLSWPSNTSYFDIDILSSII